MIDVCGNRKSLTMATKAQSQQGTANEMPWDPVWEYILGDEADERDEDGSTLGESTLEDTPKRQTTRFWSPIQQDDGSTTLESGTDRESDDVGFWGFHESGDETFDDGSWTLGLDPFVTRTSSTMTGPKPERTSTRTASMPAVQEDDARDDSFTDSFQNSIRSVLSWEKGNTTREVECCDSSPAAKNLAERRTSSWRNRKPSSPTTSRMSPFWMRRKSKNSGENKQAGPQTQSSKGVKGTRSCFPRSFSSSTRNSLSQANSSSQSKKRCVANEQTAREYKAMESSADLLLSNEIVNLFTWSDENNRQKSPNGFRGLSWHSTNSSDSRTNNSETDQEDASTLREDDLQDEDDPEIQPLQRLMQWIDSAGTESDTDGGTQESSCTTEGSSLASSESGLKVKGSMASSFTPVRRNHEGLAPTTENREAVVSVDGERQNTGGMATARNANYCNEGVQLAGTVALAGVAAKGLSYSDGRSGLEQHSVKEKKQRSASHERSSRKRRPFRRRSKKENKQNSDSRPKRNLFQRTICVSGRNKTPEEQWVSSQTGIPYDELTPQELARVFPKVRSVCDESSVCSSSVMLGSFDQNLPAHIQADLGMDGPHSLFEYEYETGVHMHIMYNEFDQIELTPMRTVNLATPVPKPAQSKKESNEVIVQVEVHQKSNPLFSFLTTFVLVPFHRHL